MAFVSPFHSRNFIFDSDTDSEGALRAAG
jgi:hypothetical protein